jgi:hypothetical protein
MTRLASTTLLALADEAQDLGNGLLAALLTIVAGLDVDTNPATCSDMALRLLAVHNEPHRTDPERVILARAIHVLHGGE